MGKAFFFKSLSRNQEKGTDLRISLRFRRMCFQMDMFGMNKDGVVNRDIHPP